MTHGTCSSKLARLGIRMMPCLLLIGGFGMVERAEAQPPGRDKPAAQAEVSLLVLFDNNAYRAGLETGWGFSCLVLGASKTILFDTGANGALLLRNMKKLGVDPRELDMVVLSHAHQDHIGGLDAVLSVNPEVEIYLLSSFPDSFKQLARKRARRVIEVPEVTQAGSPRLSSLQIAPGVYTTGALQGPQGSMDEQSLVIDTRRGLVVVTGCSHPGILDILRVARRMLGKEILLVLGGFHLWKRSSSAIQEIVSTFRSLGVRHPGPTHCSGARARQLFEEEYAKDFLRVGVGRRVELKGL